MKSVSIETINAMLDDLHSIKPLDTKLLKFDFIEGTRADNTFVRAYNISDMEVLSDRIHLGWAINLAVQYYLREISPIDIPTQVDEENFNEYYQIIREYFQKWNIPHHFVLTNVFSADGSIMRYYIVEVPEKYWYYHMTDIAKKIKQEITSLKKEREFLLMQRVNAEKGYWETSEDIVNEYAMLISSLIIGTADIVTSNHLVDSNGNILHRTHMVD